MADWTDITDEQVNPDAPVTSDLAYAFRDNPVAIAEGSSGAPKVQSEALNMKSGSGARTTEGTLFTLNNLERVSHIMATAHVVGGGASGSCAVSYRTSTNGGSTWSGYTLFVNAFGGTDAIFRSKSEVISIPTSVNTVQFSVTAASSSFSDANGCAIAIRGVTP